MNQEARDANEQMHRRRVIADLKAIQETLEQIVERLDAQGPPLPASGKIIWIPDGDDDTRVNLGPARDSTERT